jgi:hypothetical protein
MGQYKRYLRWYRLKSNARNLFLKISAKEYLDEQPTTLAEAEEFAQDLLDNTREIYDILDTDNRILWVTVDFRDFDVTELHIIPCVKFCIKACSAGLDLDAIELRGAGPNLQYLLSFLPKYARERLQFTD